MRMVVVEWVDSSHYNAVGWVMFGEAQAFCKSKPLVCQSTGFLIGEDRRSLTLALSISESQAAELVKIPKVAIVWRRDLKQVKPKKAKKCA